MAIIKLLIIVVILISEALKAVSHGKLITLMLQYNTEIICLYYCVNLPDYKRQHISCNPYYKLSLAR